jgi:polyribonucleotide nucleotidyltransferase
MDKYTFTFGGAPITWEYKKFSPLSNSAVYATWGETAVNVTVLRGKAREGIDFFPLLVEYIEKLYAAGKIASSPYVKREGFPSEEAILRGRIIDRALRPRFPKELLDEVQIFIHVLAYDKEHDPMILGFNTAVAAVMASDIPFNGELAGVRVSLDKDNKPFINPVDVVSREITDSEKLASMNMVISIDKDGIVMFDADMSEIPEDTIKESIEHARKEAEVLYNAQKEFAKMIGTEKKEGTMFVIPEEVVTKIHDELGEKLTEAAGHREKSARKAGEQSVMEQIKALYADNEEVSEQILAAAFSKLMKKHILHQVLDEGKRVDGRNFDEVRTLSAEVGIVPKVHGTGFFKRGDTHALSIATLAAPTKHQVVEDMTGEGVNTYIHEYSAPPSAYGEVGRYAAHPGRREIGHGALAEKAVQRLLPTQEEFPYMIRVVTEITSSAGSTSMASTCASTLALMDAGVPLKRPVAGISVGVIADDEFKKYQLLTDIEEIEDFYGYMDFKVAGTELGVTAIQMDQKKQQIPYEVIYEALDAAKKARTQILEVMTGAIATPRAEISKYAPRFERIQIDPDNIGKLIGPGGKVIKEITAKSGMDINIKEDGTVEIFGVGEDKRNYAKQLIDDLFTDLRIGETYEAEVIGIKPFGAIVRVEKGMDDVTGLVHVSELADKFVKNVEDVVKMGDRVKVKVVGIEDNGKLRLSIKQVK